VISALTGALRIRMGCSFRIRGEFSFVYPVGMV
jgi:hypothetical protein